MHELKVRGATRSVYNESLVYEGDFSESQRILLKLNCDQVRKKFRDFSLRVLKKQTR